MNGARAITSILMVSGTYELHVLNHQANLMQYDFKNIYISIVLGHIAIHNIMNIQIRISKYSKKHFINVNNNVVGTTIGTFTKY